MLKTDIRKQALNQRKAISDDELERLNKKLLAQFKKLDLTSIKALHIFLPIIHKKEPDTFLIIDYLEKNHPEIEIIVSKADFENSILNHYTFAGKADLINNHYHIPEPQQAKPFNGTPDMVVVPLLAFDKKGYRVGYGKGFYDRFLSGMETQKVGLSFFGPIEEINDVHLDDVRLDQCITPNEIINFKH